MSNQTDFDTFVQRLREIFFALRAVSDEMLADLDCSAVERSVLQEIEQNGPETVPVMAATRAISRQAMQKTIDRLLGHEWLRMETNPRHERSLLIALTPAGSRLLSEIRAREKRLLGGSPLPVSGAELRRVTRTLETLKGFVSSLDVRRARRVPHRGKS